MNNVNILGRYILISSGIIAVALIIHSFTGRYQFQLSNPSGAIWVIDTWTGEVKIR